MYVCMYRRICVKFLMIYEGMKKGRKVENSRNNDSVFRYDFVVQ